MCRPNSRGQIEYLELRDMMCLLSTVASEIDSDSSNVADYRNGDPSPAVGELELNECDTAWLFNWSEQIDITPYWHFLRAA